MNEIKITYCPTKDMLADVLTKGLGKEKHYCFVKGMGLLDSEQNQNQTYVIIPWNGSVKDQPCKIAQISKSHVDSL